MPRKCPWLSHRQGWSCQGRGNGLHVQVGGPRCQPATVLTFQWKWSVHWKLTPACLCWAWPRRNLYSHSAVSESSWPHGCSPPSFPISQSLLKLMSIESVMPSSHLILCHPLLLLPSVFPSFRVFPSELALHIRRPKTKLQNELAARLVFPWPFSATWQWQIANAV